MTLYKRAFKVGLHNIEILNHHFLAQVIKSIDVASDVGVNFKNVGVLSFESSLFHLFH